MLYHYTNMNGKGNTTAPQKGELVLMVHMRLSGDIKGRGNLHVSEQYRLGTYNQRKATAFTQ